MKNQKIKVEKKTEKKVEKKIKGATKKALAIKNLLSQKISVAEIMKRLKVSSTYVYNIKKKK